MSTHCDHDRDIEKLIHLQKAVVRQHRQPQSYIKPPLVSSTGVCSRKSHLIQDSFRKLIEKYAKTRMDKGKKTPKTTLAKSSGAAPEIDKNTSEQKAHSINTTKRKKKKTTFNSNTIDTTEDSATENDPPGKIRREKTFISPTASTSRKTRYNIDWNTECETENQPPVTTNA